MKSVYIILTQSGTKFSKFLKFVTKEKYNHASICLNNTFNEFYSFARKIPTRPLPAGFVTENAYKHVFGMFKEVPCLVLEKELTDEQYDELNNLINYFVENKKQFSYAFITLAFANTNYSIVSDTKYFCSQFVAKVLNEISVETPKSPEHMHPMDFTQLNGVKVVYEGDLKKFCNTPKNGSTVFA